VVRWVGLLFLAACSTSEPLRLILEAPGAQTLVVFQWSETRPLTVTVVPATELERLPVVREYLSGEIQTVVLVYPSPLAELGLAPGPLAATDAIRSRTLPPAQAYGARISANTESVAFEALAAVPDLVTTFRYAIECPTRGPGPIEVVGDCPLMFPPREARCWSEPVKVAGLEDPQPGSEQDVGAVVREGDASWLYFRATRFDPDSFARHARVRLIDPRTADPASIAPLPTLPMIVKSSTTYVVRGWTGRPWVRPDGLEMIFDSSYPDAAWWDQDVYLASRESVLDPWPLGANVLAMGSALIDDDGASSPLFLADGRTAVWLASDGVVSTWRSSHEPGNQAFLGRKLVVDEDGRPLGKADNLATSCDGGHLFIMRAGAVFLAEILALPADEHGVVKVRARPFVELSWSGGRGINTIAEAPDCDALYLADAREIFVSTPVACRR